MVRFKTKRERDLMILRLDRTDRTARQISEEVGLSIRQVQRITKEMRREHNERLDSFVEGRKPTGLGRERALDSLIELREAMEKMVDIVNVCDPTFQMEIGAQYAMTKFAPHYDEVEAALMLLPEVEFD
jgi:predicted transcriptional regulator